MRIELVLDTNFTPELASFERITFDDRLFFTSIDENGKELWVSDGTLEGTNLAVDINPGVNSSNLEILGEFGGKLYFNASDGDNSNGLWTSDGTLEGTNLVIEIDLNPDTASPGDFVELNDRLYFTFDDAVNGNELWTTDGTTEGTNLVTDLNPGINSSSPSDLTELNGNLYFSADDGVNGSELWVSDGTPEGTNLVADINPGVDSSYPGDLIEFEGNLYFNADDGVNGSELWVSDGTPEGTSLLRDVSPGEVGILYSDPVEFAAIGSVPRDFVEFDGKLYFIADNFYTEDNREFYSIELWETDGTADGTSLVSEIFSGLYGTGSAAQGNSNARRTTGYLTVLDDELLFLDYGNLYKFTLGNIGEDRIVGSDNADNITGIAANNDRIEGLNGNDTIDGALGNDTLLGGSGRDILLGLDGRDSLIGQMGDDRLFGEDQNDVLLGNEGSDYLVGGNGFDTLAGGSGADIFVIRTDQTKDTIVDFDLETDRLGLEFGLEFEDLTFVGNTVRLGDENLAQVNNINAETLTIENFVVEL